MKALNGNANRDEHNSVSYISSMSDIKSNITLALYASETKSFDNQSELERAIDTYSDEEASIISHQDQQLINNLHQLPLDYWDFKTVDTKEYTHGLHNYPAIMVCPISRNIIRFVSEIRPIHALFDPFAGSGTVLVEGMLSGIETVAGNDINPLALLLTRVKTTPINVALLVEICDLLLGRIRDKRKENALALGSVDAYITDTLGLDITEKRGWGEKAPDCLQKFCDEYDIKISFPKFKNIGYWFRPKVILELAVIKSAIDELENADIRNFVFVAFSEVIRIVSNRRNGEFKMFRMTAERVRTFNPDVYEEFRSVLMRNIGKMKDFCNALESENLPSKVTIFAENTCTLNSVPSNTYDLIITSPPYGDSRTTVAYGEFSRLSLQWLDLFDMSEKDIMSVDKSLMGGKKYKYGFEFSLASQTLRDSLDRIMKADVERAGDVYSFYVDLNDSIRSVSEKTKSGGYQFWVVGNRTVKNELLKTDTIISELASQYGLTTVYTIDRNIPNKVMPSLNSPTNITGVKCSTMTMEHIVVLRKE